MPTELTPRLVAGFKPKPGKIRNIRDGHEKSGGLELRVFPSGEKRWTVRYRNANGRQRILTIGKVADVPLGGEGGARDLARKAQQQVANGVDPADAKKARREADTVGEFAEVYMTRHAKANKKSWRNDRAMLDADILPKWKHRAMREIAKRDVRELLDAIVDRGAPIHANRVYSLLGKFFKFAMQRDVVEHNVVRDVPKPSKERKRKRVLTPDEIRTFWTFSESMPKVLRALWRVRLFTAQRPQEEVARMRWDDVDLEGAWWTIPAPKNDEVHRVPLSAPVVELLQGIRPTDVKAGALVFAPITRAPEARTGNRFPEPLHTPGDDVEKHFQPRDLRKTFRTLLVGDGLREDWLEAVINHKKAGIEGVYNLHKYDSEKRQALDHWARRIDAIVNETDGAKVLPFSQRA